MLLGPILPILISRWSLSDERAGLFFTTQFCGQFAGCLSTGVLIPLRGRGYRLTFAIGFAFIALGVAALGLGDARAGLAGTALYGYGLGLALTGGNLWVAEIFPQRRTTAVSILNVTWTIGAIACGPLVMLAEDLHILAKFLVGVALFHAICALLIGVWEIEPLEWGTDELDVGGAAPRTRLIGAATFALGGLFFLYVGTESAVGGWVAAYANRVESISAIMAALTPAFFWCGLAAGRALAPAALRSLAARKEREQILLGFGVSLAAVASGALLFAPTYRTALLCATLVGPRSRVRVPDIGGLAGSNLWRAGATIRKRYICDRQPGWGYASVACRSHIDSLRRATGWFDGSHRCMRGDVPGEWIFPWTARGLAAAGAQ